MQGSNTTFHQPTSYHLRELTAHWHQEHHFLQAGVTGVSTDYLQFYVNSVYLKETHQSNHCEPKQILCASEVCKGPKNIEELHLFLNQVWI